MENLDDLIAYLLQENTAIQLKKMPTEMKEKQRLFRSLCNLREAKEVSEDFLKVQDLYLRRRTKEKGNCRGN